MNEKSVIALKNCSESWRIGLRRSLGPHQLGLALNSQALIEAPFMMHYQNLNTAELAQALKDCYGDWGLGEMSRLVFSSYASENFKSPDFLKIFFSHPDRALETLERIYHLPLSFQNWCDDKKCSVQDLAPLRALSDSTKLNHFCEILASSSYSKSQGVQILEWALDCVLMNKMIPPFTTEQEWFEALRKLRYPETSSQDSSVKSQMEQVSWPRNTEAKWNRKGDRSFLEMKIWSSTPEELEKQSEGLLKAAEQWRKDLQQAEML